MRAVSGTQLSEIVNNAIDHSGVLMWSSLRLRAGRLDRLGPDDGIGVFRHVGDDLGWAPPQDAIVQLEKGKLTTAPTRHTGEGCSSPRRR